VIDGCKKTEINSNWKSQNIVIDGDDEEWREVQIFPKGERIALGIINNDSDLYISFRTSDQSAIMQALSRGFTIWFDPKGGKKETFGVKYPIGVGIQGRRGLMRNRSQSRTEMENRIKELLFIQSGIQIMGPEKEQVAQLPLINDKGIMINTSYSKGQFVYELKVPIKKTATHVYAINVDPGSIIGIGFKTGKFDRETMRGKMMSRGGGKPGGGMRPGGGMGGSGRGGSMGMRGGGMGPQMSESLEIWTKVTLAIQK